MLNKSMLRKIDAQNELQKILKRVGVNTFITEDCTMHFLPSDAIKIVNTDEDQYKLKITKGCLIDLI